MITNYYKAILSLHSLILDNEPDWAPKGDSLMWGRSMLPRWYPDHCTGHLMTRCCGGNRGSSCSRISSATPWLLTGSVKLKYGNTSMMLARTTPWLPGAIWFAAIWPSSWPSCCLNTELGTASCSARSCSGSLLVGLCLSLLFSFPIGLASLALRWIRTLSSSANTTLMGGWWRLALDFKSAHGLEQELQAPICPKHLRPASEIITFLTMCISMRLKPQAKQLAEDILRGSSPKLTTVQSLRSL